jgi:hypothetical protein
MTVNTRIAAKFGLLSIQLDRVRAGHDLAEDALIRHDDRVELWYKENLARKPDDSEFITYLYNEQKADAAHDYPQVLRSSLFTTGYSVLEFFMTSLCRELEPYAAGPRLRDLRGEGIRRASLYLTKVARIEFPESDEWNRLLVYGLVRNALVHSQGDLSPSKALQSIKQLQTRERTFEFAPGDAALILGKNFTPVFLETVTAFADQLDRNLESYIVVTE